MILIEENDNRFYIDNSQIYPIFLTPFLFKFMSNSCQITEKKLQFGNIVSHSKRKTRRTFLPNIQNVSFISKYIGKIQLKVSPSAIRTVEINGGLDDYLLKTKNSKFMLGIETLCR